jgi:hypothetical protein
LTGNLHHPILITWEGTGLPENKETLVYVTGVKVFSATKAKERSGLGEAVTDWIRRNPNSEIVDKIVTQSSDSEFHCLTITLFFKPLEKAA